MATHVERPTPATRTTPAAASSDEVTRPTPLPAPKTHTLIVCVPDEVPVEAFTARHLDTYFGVAGILAVRHFWAHPALRPWQRTHMIGLRRGRPALCAGGPVRLLDLDGLRNAAAVGAGIRHQQWTHAVAGTRPATPWHQYLRRHLDQPARYTLDTAVADFGNQPRVNAMRIHNTANHRAGYLPLRELEMFQAGPVAYQHYAALTALYGNGLHTIDGDQLAPASDCLADTVTYLDRAHRHLDTIDSDQRLAAVTL